MIAMITARPAKRRSVSDSDVIVAGAAFILPLELVLHASRQLASHLDWHEPIGLQERLEGRSSHNGEILRDVSFLLSGNRGYDSNWSVPWELNPQPFALLTQCSTTEPHRNTSLLHIIRVIGWMTEELGSKDGY